MDVDEVAAHLEIQQVLYRYCRGVDRGSAALIESVYHPGAVDQHGAWSGPGKSFGERVVRSMDEAGLVGQHHITNTLIELHGDEADVESYFIALHPERRGEGKSGHALVCGRYLDKFARKGGAWLIADRVVIIDVARRLGDGEAWPGLAAFPTGGRREADVSSGRFSESRATSD